MAPMRGDIVEPARAGVILAALALAGAGGCATGSQARDTPGGRNVGGAVVAPPDTPRNPTSTSAGPGATAAGPETLPVRPATSADDVAYYRERAAALATGVPTEVARTDFMRVRRGRLYLYGPSETSTVRALEVELSKAFGQGDARAILASTARILGEDQADIRAHMLRAVTLRQSGQTAEAEFHRQVAIALIDSIRGGGDGRGFDSAWTVFRVKEEYEILKALGCVVESQSLRSHGGRTFDVLRARELKGPVTFEAYFDITELFAEESRQLREP